MTNTSIEGRILEGLNDKADRDLNNLIPEAENKIIDLVMPTYPLIEISYPFTAPTKGWYRHHGANITGSIYINGSKVDGYSWAIGNWAGHASCSWLLNKGDVVTVNGNAPVANFSPIKGGL